MGDIFISYGRTDTDYAHQLVEHLQCRGLNIWIDARSDDDAPWPRALRKRLDASDAFIVIMSPRSLSSKRVQNELRRARQKSKPIFPILLEGAKPWPSVKGRHYFDARGGKLPDEFFSSALPQPMITHQIVFTPPVLKESPAIRTIASPLISRPRARLATVLNKLFVVLLILLLIGITESSSQKGLNFSLIPSSVSHIKESGKESVSQFVTLFSGKPLPATRTYEISVCCGYPRAQRSSVLDFSVSADTVDLLQVEFNMQNEPEVCSDLFLHILLDNSEIYSTARLGSITKQYTTGLIDLSQYISQGKHTLTISPEGVESVCNLGGLSRWAGELTIYTSAYPK